MTTKLMRLLLIAFSLCLVITTLPEADDLAAPTEPQKVIVLLNGRVITGDVIERPGGYLIDTAIGQQVIPFTQVRLTATDLPDAYAKLKATIIEPTASAHMALAQWCFDNRLFDSSRDQVKAALILEPERKQARTLLKQIERITSGVDPIAVTSTAPARTRDGFTPNQATAFKGLSPDMTKEYVRRIQPLVMNKCGNARCHGGTGTLDFRLAPVRLGMSGYRTLSDQNLSALLALIDVERPATSPLLIVPQGTHGGQGEIWTGPRAENQQAELRAWVIRVALEKGAIGQTGTVQTVGHSESADSGASASAARRDPFLREILDEERPDKFDPAVFNRLMHGRD